MSLSKSRTNGSYYPETYNASKGYTSPDAWANAKTIYLYQNVVDVLIGMTRNEKGDLVEMWIPIGLDQYYSPEFGGVQNMYSLTDWHNTKKEVILRGYLYAGKTYGRATKEGRELGEYISHCMQQLEDAVNLWLANGGQPTVQFIKVTPTWAWFSLFLMTISFVLLALMMSRA